MKLIANLKELTFGELASMAAVVVVPAWIVYAAIF